MINWRVVKPFVDKAVLAVLDGGIFGVDITREKSFTIGVCGFAMSACNDSSDDYTMYTFYDYSC